MSTGLKNYFILLFLVPLSACSFISPADAEITQDYLLDIPIPQAISPNVAGKTLFVAMPQAAPGFDSPAFIYIRSPYQLEYYAQSQWVDTPARLLLPLLVQYIEASGLFSAVLSATTSPVSGELRLDTEIMRFQQEFLTEPSQVRLLLRVQLLDMIDKQVIGTHSIKVLENAPSEDAQGGIFAANQAVAKALKEVAIFLKDQLD